MPTATKNVPAKAAAPRTIPDKIEAYLKTHWKSGYVRMTHELDAERVRTKNHFLVQCEQYGDTSTGEADRMVALVQFLCTLDLRLDHEVYFGNDSGFSVIHAPIAVLSRGHLSWRDADVMDQSPLTQVVLVNELGFRHIRANGQELSQQQFRHFSNR